jgi:hypothetical protein
MVARVQALLWLLCSEHAAGLVLPPPAARATRSSPRAGAPRSAAAASSASDAPWNRAAWDATEWAGRNSFDKMKLMRGMLDGSLTLLECNHAAWRGLGYRAVAGGDAPLLAPDGSECSAAPDLMADAAALARLEAELPLDDEDEMEQLDTLVETLHGEQLTRVLIDEGDADFLARRTLVRWLYTTQPELNF